MNTSEISALEPQKTCEMHLIVNGHTVGVVTQILDANTPDFYFSEAADPSSSPPWYVAIWRHLKEIFKRRRPAHDAGPSPQERHPFNVKKSPRYEITLVFDFQTLDYLIKWLYNNGPRTVTIEPLDGPLTATVDAYIEIVANECEGGINIILAVIPPTNA